MVKKIRNCIRADRISSLWRMIHHHVRHAFSICLLVLSCSSWAWCPANAAEEAIKKTPIDRLNELGYGTVSGKLQLLTMGRGGNLRSPDIDEDAYSSSLAFSLNYKTPTYQGVSLGAQFIHAWDLGEGGTIDIEEGPAWFLSNSGFTLLNDAHIDYNFTHLGLAKTLLRVGRIPLNLDFAPSYAIRQKEQAYEAVTLSSQDIPGVDLSLGHIERYSSWSSRTRTDSNVITYEFIDVADTENVPYSTSGMQFASIAYNGLPHTSLTVYDFFGQDLYNTAGFKAAYTIGSGDSFQTVLKAGYSNQRDVGRFNSDGGGEVESDVYDLSVQFKVGDFSLEPGFFGVAGDEAKNNYHVPFRTSFTVDPLMMWYPRVFGGGSDSFYLKSTYKWRNTSFYMLYVLTKTAEFIDHGSLDQEIDLVIGQKLWTHWSVTFKGAYGVRDAGTGSDWHQSDLRLFIAYNF